MIKEKILKHKKLILEIIILILIILYAVSLSPKRLQNDTYYTIAIGKLITENGIDMQEHFTWHQGLPYTYPHWLYDLLIYSIFSIGSFKGIYISTCILSAILGISIYKVNSKLTGNKIISFLVTIGSLYLMKGYIAARAQLITFILFILTVYNIEIFLETKKLRNALALIIIPILIANLHAAVWPFTFVLYLPYIAEYLISLIADFIIYKKMQVWILKRKIKKSPEVQPKLEELEAKIEKIKPKRKENLENPYKIKMTRNDNTLLLIVIMIIVLFTGILTPIGDTPYTYTYHTLKGNTMESINEHLPLTLIKNVPVMCAIIILLAIMTFTKVKIKLSDLFMIGGLTYLMFSTRRQVSMFALIGSIVLVRLLVQLIDMYGIKSEKNKIFKGILLIIFATIVIVLSINNFDKRKNETYVNESSYPVQASEWILNNLDVKNIRLYNEYNYGSYLLFRGIPVFIDSRADVYDPQFNGGLDIFGDFIGTSNISKYYGTTFKKYDITHIIISKNSKTNMIITKTEPEKYKQLYSDDNFVIYEILKY